jgi:hypothetical protein
VQHRSTTRATVTTSPAGSGTAVSATAAVVGPATDELGVVVERAENSADRSSSLWSAFWHEPTITTKPETPIPAFAL